MNRKRTTTIRHAATVCLALALVACGEDAPPEQVPQARVEMTGVAVGGAAGQGESVAEVSAKGSAGRLRTAVGSASSVQYAVSLTELTGPYALSAAVRSPRGDARVYSLAVAQGTANITPLTSLLVAQLYGQDPAITFQGFGSAGGIDSTRVTALALQQAQARVVAFIQEELGVTIPGNAGDFVTTPFRSAAGDPMHDSIVAVTGKLQSLDMTLDDFAGRLALAARLCLVEQVSITIGGTRGEFCPLNKTATPLDNDPQRLEYVYADRRGNVLTVTLDGETVSAVRYEDGGGTYLCAAPACGALSLGAPAADLTRAMQFQDLVLTGAGGSVAVAGTLTGAIPGIVMPVLPCDGNRYFVVFQDRSVVGACANVDPYGFGMGALLGNQSGVAPSRMRYDFAQIDGSDPTRPQLSIVTDANDALLAVQFLDYEPDTYTPRRTFSCRLEECNGVTLGPVTENTDILGSDPPILVRTVTLEDTQLRGHDADGNPTGETARLSASVNTAYFDFVAAFYTPPIEYPPQVDCTEPYEAVAAMAGMASFNLCVTPTGTALEQPNGDVLLVAGNYETDGLRILLRAGVVVQATVSLLNQPLGFMCSNDCAGISVSQPDTNGLRTLHFDSPTLHESLLDHIQGPRSLVLNGGTVVFDAQVPQP